MNECIDNIAPKLESLWPKFCLKSDGSILMVFSKSCRSISYFSSLLDKNDRSVRIAAGEALALIFEIGSLEKFSAEANGSNGGSQEGYTHVQGLKGKILSQVRNLSIEAGGKGSAKKDLNNQRNLFKDILEFLEV